MNTELYLFYTEIYGFHNQLPRWSKALNKSNNRIPIEQTAKIVFHKSAVIVFVVYDMYGAFVRLSLLELPLVMANNKLECKKKKSKNGREKKPVQLRRQKSKAHFTNKENIFRWFTNRNWSISLAGVENHQNFSDHVMWAETFFLYFFFVSNWKYERWLALCVWSAQLPSDVSGTLNQRV